MSTAGCACAAQAQAAHLFDQLAVNSIHEACCQGMPIVSILLHLLPHADGNGCIHILQVGSISRHWGINS